MDIVSLFLSIIAVSVTVYNCYRQYFKKTEGISVVDPVFVLSAILDWAGIAHNERGYLELTADYRTRAEGR